MNQKPAISSILMNDSWAAPALGAFITSFVITVIVLAVDPYLVHTKSLNPPAFVGMTIIFFMAAFLISVFRVRYVNTVFKKGVIVKAQIIKTSVFRSNLRLYLQYTYLSQTCEKKVEQVITGKTRKLMDQKDLDLVIDPENTDHVLIWNAYF